MDLREAAATSDRLGLMEETFPLLPAEFQAATCTSSQLGAFQVVQEKKTPHLHWNTPGFSDKLPTHVCLQFQGTWWALLAPAQALRPQWWRLLFESKIMKKPCQWWILLLSSGLQPYGKTSFLFFFLQVWEHAVLRCNLKASHHYIAARKGYSGEKENTPVWSSW